MIKRSRSICEVVSLKIIMDNESVVLSFHETLLRQSDIHLLEGPYWLNDTIISFYFEYLEKIVFSSATELLFVSPEVTQCIKMVTTEEINTFLEPRDINRKEFVFFALNDNDSPDSSGGSHWSLLVYSKPEKYFFHLDSMSDGNHIAALELANHLVKYFTKGDSIRFMNKECLRQSNGYDCGIHVICNTERLAEWAHHFGQIDSCNMLIQINPSIKRQEILNIIQNLTDSD